MKRQKISITFLLIISCLLLVLPYLSLAQGTASTMSGFLDNIAKGAGYETAGVTDTTLAETVGSIIAKILEIIGIIFMVFMIYGGWIWMKAKGNEEQVTRAKNILNNAAIGLLIILTSYVLTWFIVSSLGVAVGLTNFGF